MNERSIAWSDESSKGLPEPGQIARAIGKIGNNGPDVIRMMQVVLEARLGAAHGFPSPQPVQRLRTNYLPCPVTADGKEPRRGRS